MTKSASRSRKLLVGCVAAAALALAASPASADVYELQYSTASAFGDIFFYAPPPGMLPAPITGIVPNGTIVNGNPVFSTETTIGNGACPGPAGCFNNSGSPQLVTGLLPPGTYFNQYGAQSNVANDNLLLSFVPNVSLHPPKSNLDTTWFTDPAGVTPQGVAFLAADGTQVNLFTYDAGGGPQLTVESMDTLGNLIDSPGTGGLSTLTDLSSPGPTPGAGFLGLLGLALGAATLRLRERLAR